MSSAEPTIDKPIVEKPTIEKTRWFDLSRFLRTPDDTARQFLPAALEILETPASPVGRTVGASLILFFSIAIVWATFGHVDIIATAGDPVAPAGASEMDVARTKSAMRAQAMEQLAKLASLRQQIEQKKAEAQSITATIAKIDGQLPLLQETLTIRQRAMEIQYGN